MMLLILVVCVLALYPLLMLIAGSFLSSPPGSPGYFTIENYRKAFMSWETYSLFYNTLVYAIGKTILAVTIGTSLAWIVTRTNTPYARAFEFIAVVPFMMPILLKAVAWLFLLSPRVGFFNTSLMWLFRLEQPPFNANSMPAMIFVAGLSSVPIVFLMVSAALRSMDPSLEEAAQILGSSVLSTMRRVTLPIMKPALLSVALLAFIMGVESFEIPAVLGTPAGIYVYTTQIVYSLRQQIPPMYGLATAYSMLILVITLVCLYFYRRTTARIEKYVTVTGKGYRPGIINLGKWRYATFVYCVMILLLMAVLPLFALILFSLAPYLQPISIEMLENVSLENYLSVLNYPAAVRAFTNSMILALTGATLCMFFVSVISYSIHRTEARGKGFLDAIAMSGLAIPSTVFGVGMLWGYMPLPISIFGTLWILLIAYIGKSMAFGLRYVSTNMIQIHKDLEDSSRTLGASWPRTFVRIVLPLVRPGFIAGWIWLFLIYLRELSQSILLYTHGTETISVVILDLIEIGGYPSVAALGVLVVLVSSAAYGVVLLFQRRTL